MKKKNSKTGVHLMDDLLAFSKDLIDKQNGSYVKIKCYKFYTKFLDAYPIQYQRNDKTTLSFQVFCKGVKNSDLCMNWKINRKRNKQFSISRKKVNKYFYGNR